MIRLIVRILILLFVLALLLAIFAPSILSTNFGKHALFRILKSMSGYEIQVKELKLSWMKGQSVEKIDVVDHLGRSVFHADAVVTSAPLWKVIFYHDMGHLQVTAPFVLIEPSQQLASKLAMRQAGFSLSFSMAPSFHLLGEINVTEGAAQFVTPGLEPISVKEIQLTASLLPKQIKIQALGKTEEASSQGTFHIQMLAYPESSQIDASAEVNHFPLRALDQLVSLLYPEMKGVIRETIGESLNAEVRLKNLEENFEIYLNATSDHFSAHLETKLEQNTLTLASPALIHFQIPGKAFSQLTSLSIQNDLVCQITLDKLSMPLQNHRLFTVQGTLKAEALQFEDWTLEPFSFFVETAEDSSSNWNVKIDSPQIQFNGLIHLPEAWQQVSFSGQALLPKNTKLDISADSLKSISIVAQGDVWRGNFKGAFDPFKKTVSLIEPGSLTVNLAQLPAPLPPLLKASLPIQVSVEPCVINLQTQTGLIKGKAGAPAFELGSAQVDPTTVQFTGDFKTRQIQFALTSKVDQGPLSIEGVFFSPTKINLKGSCKDFPIASIQPFLQNGPPLLPFLGETLTTDFQASLSENNIALQLKATSPLLTLQAKLSTAQNQLYLIEPATFTWTLTPDGYAALTEWLKSSSPLSLSQKTVFKGSIESLFLPLQSSAPLDQSLSSLQYQGKMTADQLAFVSNQQTIQVNQLQIQLTHLQPSLPHQFQLSATAVPQGTLSCKGSWTPSGTAEIHLFLDQFPSAAFDLFAAPFKSHNFSLATLCGPIVNFSLDTTLDQWSGPVKFKLYSTNLRTSLQGALKQGTLSLAEPFHLQLDLTTQLSKMLFQEMNPLSLSSVRSDGPITLEIAPQGFAFPISSADLSQIQIGSGRLELGKLRCQNEGNVQMTLGLLKLGQYKPGDELKLWFAPLDFRIQNGVLNCERTEILIADNFQVCLWGDVDFPENKIDSVLGLTANCLRNAFGIKNLPDDYVLQIPLKGTLTDVKINKSSATAKIAALLIWQQKGAAASGIVKGPAGALLGDMLDKLGPLPGGDQKAPPAKKPFPWGKQGDQQSHSTKKKTSEASSEHRKLIRPDDSALKQALKFLR